LASLIIGVLFVSFSRTVSRLSKPVSVLLASSVAMSALLSYFLTGKLFDGSLDKEILFLREATFTNVKIELGFLVDQISGIMLAAETTGLFLLIILSHGFMNRNKDYVKVFILLGLFTSSTLGLVGSINLIEIGIFWLLIGLLSTLLTKPWYEILEVKHGTSNKIFWSARFSDVSFLISIYAIYSLTGSFDIEEVGLSLDELISLVDGSGLKVILICTTVLAAIIARFVELPFYLLSDSSKPIHLLAYFVVILSICSYALFRLQPIISTGFLLTSF